MNNEEVGRRGAEDFRQEFHLGIEPIADIARTIEQAMGIGVAYVAVPAPGHGMTMRLEDRYLMAVGCTPHPMRLRSTLAHELGHLRLNSVDQYLGQQEWEKRRPDEIQADAFARHLLIPLTAAEVRASRSEVTTAVLSDLVQRYKVSPAMVAIQLRETGFIDADISREWQRLTARQLAVQYGWHSEYQVLVSQSEAPRPPQPLLARAIEGYRWGLVSPAAISRLDGIRNPNEVAAQLESQGIIPFNAERWEPERPADTGNALTAEELAILMGDDN